MTLLRKLAAVLAACLITSPAWGQTLSTPGAGTGIANTFTAAQTFTGGVIPTPNAGVDTSATAVGLGALASDASTNSSNTAFGANALNTLSSGIVATAIGAGAAQYVTATGVTSIGYHALQGSSSYNGTGTYNVAVGASALGYPGTIGASVAIGASALSGNSSLSETGSNNVAVGLSSFGSSSATALSNNVGVGTYTGYAATGSSNETLIGYKAGYVLTGNSNTVVGSQVGSGTLTTGTGNILIGTSSSVDTVASGTSNEINIGQGYINFATAPTITTGQALGTTPTITANSSHVFKAVVGATPTGTTETIGLPTAPTGWFCTAWDITTSANTAKQTASSATGATMTWSGTLTASDVILHNCDAY